MPEGPEVKHTTDLLKKYLQGKSLKSVEIFGGRYSRHGPPKGWNTLQEYLSTHPLKIDKVDCIGKFIYWRFINHDDKPFYMSCTVFIEVVIISKLNVVKLFVIFRVYYCYLICS